MTRNRMIKLTLTGVVALWWANAAWAQPVVQEPIKVTKAVEYAKVGDISLKLDVLEPESKSKTPRPAIVFIHGVGWRAGDRQAGLGMLRPLVRTGKYVGFTVSYRLSDKALWPAQLHDVKSAIRWIRNHAKDYNIDPDRIAAWGTSAGGHLVALLATTSDVPELEGTVGPNKGSSKVACVVDYFGPTDFLTMHQGAKGAVEPIFKIDDPKTPMAQLLGGKISDLTDKAKEASPIQHISKGDSPVLILHGTNDKLVPYLQSTTFREAYRKKGLTCLLVEVTGAGHGFRHASIDNRVQAFLGQQLLGQKIKVSESPIDPSSPEPR